MDLRITPQALFGRNVGFLRRQSDALAGFQEQVATGLKLNRPSDSPQDFIGVVENKGQVSRMNAFLGNIRDGKVALDVGVSTLTQVGNLLTKARQVGLEGANATTDKQVFETLAREVDNLLDGTLNLANTEVNGRFLFGGTATQTQPFRVTATNNNGLPTQIGFAGSDNRVTVPISQSESVETLYSGREVFQTPGKDVFQSLIALRDALRSGPTSSAADFQTAIQGALGQVENAQDGVRETVASMAASLENLETVELRTRDVQLQIQTRISDVESADFAEVVIGLKTQETLFSASLAVSGRILDTNILDFLR